MGFCQRCGNALAAPVPVAETVQLTCVSCGRTTPTGFAFCQHCGTRFAPVAAAPTPAPAPTSAATPPRESTPRFAPGPPPSSSSLERPTVSMSVASIASAAGPSAPHVATASALGSIGRAADARVRIESKGPARGRLVVVLPGGTDGDSTVVSGDSFDIGRVDGSLVFASDPYLAPRHARLLWSGGALRVRALDGVNGVYVRMREGHDLATGDQLLIGRQLLRYEGLAPEEREPPPLVEHGVRLFGSSPREAWGRLRQITTAGTTRNVWHLIRSESVIGRTEGDVTFPDDDQVSARHAILRRGGPRARVEDVPGAEVFLRVRGERELRSGDILRLGEQTLRFDKNEHKNEHKNEQGLTV